MSLFYKEAVMRIQTAKHHDLKVLDLSELDLIQIPEEIVGLNQLSELRLHSNKLTSLPDFIGNLENLTFVDLEHNQLTNLPESFGRLRKLANLNLRFNHLTSFPDVICKLGNLAELILSANRIATIQVDISNLSKLHSLWLDSNRFTTIPDPIVALKNLPTLLLSYNHLSSLPESIGKMTQLSRLFLEGNQLASLPESIGKLSNLKHLLLEGNQLSSLPKSIGELTKLKILSLDNNQLSTLPGSTRELSELYTLGLENNKFNVGAEIYELPPQEQINEILKWQRAQEAGTLQPIHEAKVIFIGESNYGKTHLIELLRNGEIKRTINTTHGIERSQVIIPYKDKDIHLNIWDLGGQEFMRSTHQFFFSERTLYILVTLARRERNELNHWLKLANQLGNKAPVLVVINKIDLDPHDLDRRSLERDYPNIVGFIRTCIYDCDDGKASDTLEVLKKKIMATVGNKNIMPGVFEQRPPEWFAVKEGLEKLEAKGTDFITYEEYENLNFIKTLPEEERKSNLKLLSMIGAVVSFVDDPRLIDTNVINPQWIMDGVYAIINDPVVKDETKGRLHIKDLERILPKKKFPKSRHAYLLELMQKFNLCYAANDKRDIYFIPDLFVDIEPNLDWDSSKSMHFRYNYDDFPPDAFITRFIVEMHQDIQGKKRWRSGVFISNGACQAKVYQTYRKNYIHVEVMGKKGEDRSYLYAIRETFRKLHKPFPQMQIKQEVLYKDYWLDYLRLIKLEERNKTWYHDKLDEDLPVTDILNGYSTPIDREGTQKHLKIFLASSAELKEEREEFEIFIHRENQQLYKKGVFIELQLWENSIDAMSRTRLQDEYNNVVKHSDIFVSLFFTKVGMYTLEEFETAFGQFKKTGRPLVYTYFKDAPINVEKITGKIQSLLDFRKKLEDLGHFRTIYKNIDDLKFQFKNQIEKILPLL
ncbi:MAG: 50S ribosome-binding GTPase [FCB group bacterium]|nr:50S ribosome-binding GTPase [FCB group bacterium]MBL7027398.1 50S ribosome-binding GTPase [Candidatus Neomarinimicrobiota bacterium]MBL7122651.1 50S ribosome-binding GTPase [Candidatus Neomarinimicrobiota bacterium]